MKRLVYALLLCLLPACGGGGSGTPTPIFPPNDENIGTWTGNFKLIDTSVEPEHELNAGFAEVSVSIPVSSERYAVKLTAVSGEITLLQVSPDLGTWSIQKAGQFPSSFVYGHVAPATTYVSIPGKPKMLNLRIPALSNGSREYRILAIKAP